MTSSVLILQEGSSRQPLCCVLGIIGGIKPAYSLFQMLECQVGRQWVPFYSLWYDPTRDQPTNFRSDTPTKPLSFTQCSFRFVNLPAVSHCTTCKHLSSNWPESKKKQNTTQYFSICWTCTFPVDRIKHWGTASPQQKQMFFYIFFKLTFLNFSNPKRKVSLTVWICSRFRPTLIFFFFLATVAPMDIL